MTDRDAPKTGPRGPIVQEHAFSQRATARCATCGKGVLMHPMSQASIAVADSSELARLLCWRIVGQVEALSLVMRQISLPDHHRLMVTQALGDFTGLADEVGMFARKKADVERESGQ